MEKMWLTSVIENIRSLPDGEYETISQIMKLIGMSTQNFETLLKILSKSNYSVLTFEAALGTEVVLSKTTNDHFETTIKLNIARGEAELRYSFDFTDWQTKIPGENLL